MTEYSYGPYTADRPGRDESGAALAVEFVRLVTGLPGIQSICDLGSGNGYMSGLLLDRNYAVVGVDASESGVRIAREAHGTRGRFVCARIDAALPRALGGAQFDAVVSSDVIEHLYRPADLVDCASRILAPGGWLLIGTPYHGYLKNLALSVLDHWDAHHGVDWDGGHIKFFSVKTLSSLVASAGFTVQRFAYHGRAPFLWKNMICVARKSSAA